MDIVDEVLYKRLCRERPSPEEVADAYRELFAVDSKAAAIVVKDLIHKTQLGSRFVCENANLEYHLQGQRAVIQYIKDGINAAITPQGHSSDATIVDDNEVGD